MTEPSPPASPVQPSPAVPKDSAEAKPLPHMGEEFGTAAKNLPPVKIVLIGVAAVVLVALVFALMQRPHSSAKGSIAEVAVVDIPDQNSVLVAVNVSVHNGGSKPFWVHTIQADLSTADGNHYSDEAAPAVDFDRYFQAFPALKQNAHPALKRETMIAPGADLDGTIIVSFPVTQDAFNERKELRVTIQPYDQPVALVMSK